MSDPRQMAGQPSQEEMRAYLEQLREADAAGLVAEAFNLLATGAQVKLGRPDARVLIDSLAALVEAADPALPGQVTEQMRQGVAQLQMAQVQAEKEAQAAEGAGGATEGAADDADTGEKPPQMSAPPPPQGPGAGAGQRMTDRLWVPGRDPRPPSR